MDTSKLSAAHLVYATLTLLLISRNGVEGAGGLSCYQCNSTSDRTCGESLPQHHSLTHLPCTHILNAQFCVKMTGLVEGQLGTKRFCSARDWGNYCEWVQRPGDEREYRACIFTCQTYGCNHAAVTTAATLLLIPPLLLSLLGVM